MKKLWLLITILTLGITSQSQGQYISNVRSLSLGRTGVANMFGLDAFYNNPANVGRQRHSFNAPVYFSLMAGASAGLSGEYFSYDFYRQYLISGSSRIITTEEKADVISRAADKQTNFFITWNFLSFIYNTQKAGTFGISVDDKFGGDVLPTKDLMDIMLYGNTVGRKYDISGFNFFATYIRQINFTYANKIKIADQKKFSDFNYGFSIKPQLGYYYFGSGDGNNYTVYTDSLHKLKGVGGFDAYYAGLNGQRSERMQMGFFNPAGLGLGFDLGGSIRIKDFLGLGTFDFGLSVIDIGYINWYGNSSRYHYNGDYFITNILDSVQYAQFEDILTANRHRENFVTMLPTTVRFGFNYRLCLHKKGEERTPFQEKLEFLGISMEYIQGLTDKNGGSTNPMFAMGTEMNLGRVFSARVGLTAGGREKFTVSAGIGIDTGPIIFDVGTYNIQSIYNSKTSAKLSAGVSFKVRIN